MILSLNQNARMHTLRRDIPSINAELHRSSFNVRSSVDFFCVLWKFLVLLIPMFSIWYLEIISCYLKGRTALLISQGQKGEWELRASSVHNNLDVLNSISPAWPVHSPELIGRKTDQMSTEDWQFIYCSAKCFKGCFPPNKSNACK